MDTSLDDLASCFRPLAEQLLDGCVGAGIPVRVVDTLRTPAQQEQALTAKRSWTHHSKHLPQPPENKSEAIDIVPLAILAGGRSDWDPGNSLWDKIGAVGMALGLEWGGQWATPERDPSHFQYKEPSNEGKT